MPKDNQNSENKTGRYGEFGGSYVAETLMPPLHELENAFEKAKISETFKENYNKILRDYVGRPTAITEVQSFSQAVKGPRIYLKREDLLHTGAHKINNALGQCLLAKELGKTRIVAETGAGQHGVATATACAYLDLKCVIYMGRVDAERQQPNVIKMRLLGADVKIVESGSETLKDAVNDALRDWVETHHDSHYCLGSVLGPHPFPHIVAYFQSVIGREAREQIISETGDLPKAVIACVGGGSNAIGIFSGFLEDKGVQLIGVEGGGTGDSLGEHAARIKQHTIGILHGTKTYVLQDQFGQVAQTHSISAGLDYPAIGPQHAELYRTKRATYTSANDESALEAFKLLTRTEGIIPALESSHALAYFLDEKNKKFNSDDIVLVNLSGRGDKDLPALIEKGLV
jgi:phosphoribosylanthranilate isomerase